MKRQAKKPEQVQACPDCDDGHLYYSVRDVHIVRRGEKAWVPQVAGLFCDSCDNIEFDETTDSGDRYAKTGDELVLKARRKALALGKKLKRARDKLNLSQAEAAALAGGGHNAFSRYENGAARPVAAVALLFALLERHPELLPEARKLARQTETLAVV